MGFALSILTAYVLMEMCNSNSLIRVYTRSVSSFFLLSASCLGFMHPWRTSTIAALSVTTSIYMVFKVSQKNDVVIDTFHIMLLLGLACVFVPQLVVLLLFYYWFIYLMSHTLSFRAFWAGIIGFVMPGCAALGICDLTGNLNMAWEWYGSLVSFTPIQPESYCGIDVLMAGCWAVLVLLTLWCGVYYANNRQRDKTKIRTLYQILYALAFVLILMVALQPHLADSLFPVMLVSVSPMVAHYFSLSETRHCAVVFFLTLLLLCVGGILTLTDYSFAISMISNIIN